MPSTPVYSTTYHWLVTALLKMTVKVMIIKITKFRQYYNDTLLSHGFNFQFKERGSFIGNLGRYQTSKLSFTLIIFIYVFQTLLLYLLQLVQALKYEDSDEIRAGLDASPPRPQLQSVSTTDLTGSPGSRESDGERYVQSYIH